MPLPGCFIGCSTPLISSWRARRVWLVVRLSSPRGIVERLEGAEKAGLTLEEWVSDAWAQANAMHTRFYEDWCTRGTWNKR